MHLLRLLFVLLLIAPASVLAQDDDGDDPTEEEAPKKTKGKKGKDEPAEEETPKRVKGKGKAASEEPADDGGVADEPAAEEPADEEPADEDDEAETDGDVQRGVSGATIPATPPPAEGKEPLPPNAMQEYMAREDAPKPRISDFIATRLTFYIGDDNLLAGNADRSPALGMTNAYPELFFEGLNAEKVKAVTETHFVLYAKAPGFLPFVDTEGAFVGEFEFARDPDDARPNVIFRDDGSWLAATFWFGEKGNSGNLKLVAWPFSADRFRLGWTYDLTWAGDRLWTRNRAPVPGGKIALDLKVFEAFVGAKSLIRQRADNNEVENYWGVLGGLGPRIPITDDIKLQYDVAGGYFTRGTFQQDPHRSQPVVAFGASQRLLFAINEPWMGRTPDTRLMFNDLDEPVMPWQKLRALTWVPDYRTRFGLGITLEVNTIGQTLIDADNPSARVFDDAIAAAFRGRVRFMRNMRVGLDVVYRDVSFLVLNVPGLTPYVSFASETEQASQVFGAIWWDWFIDKLKIRPGVTVALMQPASFKARADASGSRQVQVIREANDYEILPAGTDPFSLIAVKASLRWHLSPILALVGEVAYVQDFNNTRVVTDPNTGVGVRELDQARARQLGLNFFMQAAF